jgi:uncharacterized protein YceH (UPF0502 family)
MSDFNPGLISSASAPAAGRVSEVWSESAASDESQPSTPAEPPPSVSVELTAIEARVLGAMIEKSFLTPDVYPMTTNAMVTACNQKTNRDPVVSYSAVEIDSVLLELRQRNLVRRVHTPGSRSTKHRQTLDEALSLNERQLALISVLLLRGAQTIGELRIRTERHDVGFDDLEAVEATLSGLSSRSTPLVRELARQPGQKENRWIHLLAAEDDATNSAAPAPATSASASPVTPGSGPATSAPPAANPLPAATGPDLQARVTELETEVATLRRQLASLADKLGEPLS